MAKCNFAFGSEATEKLQTVHYGSAENRDLDIERTLFKLELGHFLTFLNKLPQANFSLIFIHLEAIDITAFKRKLRPKSGLGDFHQP